ncbi:MAG TPA: hypothetical protein VE863_09430 [Pyrinomonadaceae bacterium]|jgi:hypothetical protein|nr:hypothetical protein [Pyrinomonadaceae bacterium]
MKKIWLLTILVFTLPAITAAQTSGDYDRWDFYGGYSLGRFTSNVRTATFNSSGGSETFTGLCTQAFADQNGANFQKFFCKRRNFSGFDASVTRNVSRVVGITGDVTGHWKKSTYVDVFNPPGVTQTEANDEKFWNFLAGVQIKDNRREKKLKPFGHVLAGFAHYTNQQSQTLDLFPQFNFVIQDHVTSFAMKLGGGLDLRIAKRIDIRVVGVDYNPVFAKDRNADRISGPFTASFGGRLMNGFTVGAGIVIH